MSASDLMTVVADLCMSLAAGLLAVILIREIREELNRWRSH